MRSIMSVVMACVAGVTLTAGTLQVAPKCRVYSADEVRTAAGGVSGSVSQTCRFDPATTSRICTIRARLTNTTFELALTDRYASAADFVDEVRVIPPIARIQKQTRRYTSGSATGGQIDYEYDATRRQTRLLSNMGGNLLVTTYGGWDLHGRPTTARVGSSASTFSLQYSYDDVARTMTTTGPAGSQVETYDADGNMVHERATSGMGVTNYAIKILKTDKVCK